MFATKITGKPYAGKLHVRIDEGEKRKANTPRFSLLYWFNFLIFNHIGHSSHRE